MRYSDIRTCDLNNGNGLMVTLWTQGCSLRCSDKCHNKHLWDFEGGKLFTEEKIQYILSLLDSPQNFACLGGEPVEVQNIEMLTKLFAAIKSTYPNKEIWMWTGRKFNDIKHLEMMQYINYITDGEYQETCSNKGSLLWRGSSNQRNIDVQKSLFQRQIVLSTYN